MKWRRTLSRNKHGYCSISVPEQIAHELGGPQNGMPADLELEDGKLIITPAPEET